MVTAITPAFDPRKANYVFEVNNVYEPESYPGRIAGDTTAVQVNGGGASSEALVPLRVEKQHSVTVTLLSDEWAAYAVPLQKAYLLSHPDQHEICLLLCCWSQSASG